MTGVLIRDKRGETQTQGGGHVKIEAEVGVMQTQALGPPEATRSWRR